MLNTRHLLAQMQTIVQHIPPMARLTENTIKKIHTIFSYHQPHLLEKTDYFMEKLVTQVLQLNLNAMDAVPQRQI